MEMRVASWTKLIQLLVGASALTVSACAGANSYMAPITNSGTTTASTPSNTGNVPGSPAPVDYSRPTGIVGTVGIPAPASFGATPQPAQLAAPGGPTLDSIAPPSSVSFPALTSILQSSTSGLTAVSANEGATVVLNAQVHEATFQLIVPAVNLNRTFTFDGSGPFNPSGQLSDYPYDYGDTTFGLSYVALGGWGQWGWGSTQPENPLQSSGVFAFGYETPGSAMPGSGTAAFNGVSLATVFTSAGTDIRAADAIADAAFSVDFGSGKITGAFTHSQYFGAGGWLPWNDISVTASIAAGTSKFSGATAVTSAPKSAFTLNSSATGSINGGFYGPAAQNIGAIWTLSDGTTSAIGGVAASRAASGP